MPIRPILQLASSSIISRFDSIDCFVKSDAAAMLTVTDFLGSALCSLRTLRMAIMISCRVEKVCSTGESIGPGVGHGARMRRLEGESIPRCGRTVLSRHQIVSVMKGIIGCIKRSAPSSTLARISAVCPARCGSFRAGLMVSTYQSQKSRQKKS